MNTDADVMLVDLPVSDQLDIARSCAKKALWCIACHFAHPEPVYRLLVSWTCERRVVCVAGGAVLHVINPTKFPLVDVDLFMICPAKDARLEMFLGLLNEIKRLFPLCRMFGFQCTHSGLFLPVIDVLLYPADGDTVSVQLVGGWCHHYSNNTLFRNMEEVLLDFSEDYVQAGIFDNEITSTFECRRSLETSIAHSCAMYRMRRAVRSIQKGISMPMVGFKNLFAEMYRIPHVACRKRKDILASSGLDNVPKFQVDVYKKIIGEEIDYNDTNNNINTNQITKKKAEYDVNRLNETHEFVHPATENDEINDERTKLCEKYDVMNLHVSFIGEEGEINLSDHGKEHREHLTHVQCRWITTRVIINTLLRPIIRRNCILFYLDMSCPWSQWMTHIQIECSPEHCGNHIHFQTPHDRKESMKNHILSEMVYKHGQRLGFGRWQLPAVRVQLLPFDRLRKHDRNDSYPYHYINTNGSMPEPTTCVPKKSFHNLNYPSVPYMRVAAIIDSQYQYTVIPMLPRFSIFALEKRRVQDVCTVLCELYDCSDGACIDQNSPFALFVMCNIVLKDTEFRYRNVYTNGDEPIRTNTTFNTFENEQDLDERFETYEKDSEYKET